MPSDINDSNWLNQSYDADRIGAPQTYTGIALPSRGGANTGGPSAPVIGMDGMNVPSKPKAATDGASNTQASRRWTATLFDMHRYTGPGRQFPKGRPWTGEMELAANPDRRHDPGFVTTDLMQGEYITDDSGQNDRAATFGSVWSAPWVPLAKYFQFNYKRGLITFNYQRMATDEDTAERRYYEAAAMLGAQLGVRVDFKKVPPFAITAKLGMPRFLGAVARAAMAGDRWLLGFIDEPNEELAKLLGFDRFGLRTSYNPEEQAKGLITPEQVIATPPDQMAALMARLEEMQAEIVSLRAEKDKRSEKGKKTASSTPAEQPAA